MDIETLQNNLPGLPRFLGMVFTHVDKDRIVAEITVREEHCTEHNTIHGGAIMAYADTMGAMGTIVNLRDGQITTTIESKTNFFAATPAGAKLIAETVPLHRGRRTQVWETRLLHENGKLAAKVTQTQIVLEKPQGATP